MSRPAKALRFLLAPLALSMVACSPNLRHCECDEDNDCDRGQHCNSGVCQPLTHEVTDAGEEISLDLDRVDGAEDLTTEDLDGDPPSEDLDGDPPSEDLDGDPPSDVPASDGKHEADPGEDEAEGDSSADGLELDSLDSDSCWADASAEAPTVNLDSLPSSLRGGSRRHQVELTFSEPVWGFDRRSVTIDGGAIIVHIVSDDRPVCACPETLGAGRD